MPFTPTHVLAAVPLARWLQKLPFSALAIGCMIPDLPLFVPAVKYMQTHNLSGMLAFCLPLGLAVFMLYECLLKVPLVALLPRWFQLRMTSHARPTLKPSWWFFLGVGSAMCLGTATHIFWDAFTHEGQWGTRVFPWLNETFVVNGKQVRYYNLLQHLCTLIGLPLLLVIWLRELIQTTPAEKIPAQLQLTRQQKALGWSLVIIPPVLVALWKVITEPTWSTRAFFAVTYSGTTWMLMLLVYAGLHLKFTHGDRQTGQAF